MTSIEDFRVLHLMRDLTTLQGAPILMGAEPCGGFMLHSNLNPATERIHDRVIPILEKPVNLKNIISWLEARIEMVKLKNGSVLRDQPSEVSVGLGNARR